MARAFIMIKVDSGHAEEVRQDIADLPRVREAHVVAGEFDIIAEAEAEEVYEVIHSAATDIRGIAPVTDTRTYMCLE